MCVFLQISKVHMSSLPSMSLINSSQSTASPAPGVAHPPSPVQFISGPVTSSRPASALDARFDDDEVVGMLSPVPTEFNESSQLLETSLTDEPSFQQHAPSLPATLVTALRDAVGNRFSVELANGAIYRASLALHSSCTGSKRADVNNEMFKLLFMYSTCI